MFVKLETEPSNIDSHAVAILTINIWIHWAILPLLSLKEVFGCVKGSFVRLEKPNSSRSHDFRRKLHV